jgi:predicted transcriptional regulator
MTAPLISRAQARTRLAQDRLQRLQGRRRRSSVKARLDALELELQESRQLNRRITELVDVVAELLVPIADRDEERVQEVLAQYRASI